MSQETKILRHERDTYDHIQTVQRVLHIFLMELARRAESHDRSKLEDPEAEKFAEASERLAETTYGSEEYKRIKEEILGPALEHHYAHNDHHPEHFEHGVNDMDLFQLAEMVADWLAAADRHDDGNPFESLKINQERFELSDQLVSIIRNTFIQIGVRPAHYE